MVAFLLRVHSLVSTHLSHHLAEEWRADVMGFFEAGYDRPTPCVHKRKPAVIGRFKQL